MLHVTQLKRPFLGLFITFFIFLSFSVSTATAQATGQITGTVTDGVQPLDDINVVIYRYNTGTGNGEYFEDIHTSPQGHFTFIGLEPGVYRIKFEDSRHENYQTEYYDNTLIFDNATNIQVIAGQTVSGINANLALRDNGQISNIQRPRFARPIQSIPVKLTFKISNPGNIRPRLGIKLPDDWRIAGSPVYNGNHSGGLNYNAALTASLETTYGGNWWAGEGAPAIWDGTPTTINLTLYQSPTTIGDYKIGFIVGSSLDWNDFEEAPLSITNQQPVRGVDVTSVRDEETFDIGVSTSLQQAQNMNMQVIYHYLGWDAIEVEPQYYHWVILEDILKQSRAYNQKVVLRIYNPPAHYADTNLLSQGLTGQDLQAQAMVETKIQTFMQRLTDHVKEKGYNDVIAGYVIWNEPNIQAQWLGPGYTPSAMGYITMLQSAYTGAKAGDPAAVIISAPLAPTADQPGVAINDLTYLSQLYDLGLANYVDYIGVNGLGYQYDPDHDSGYADYNFMRLKYLHDVMLSKGDTTHKAWVLEVGWLRDNPNNMGEFEAFKVSKEEQAQYLCHAFEKANSEWAGWVDLMTIWNLDFNLKDYYPPESAFYWYAISDNELAEDCLTNLVLEVEIQSVYLPIILHQ